MGEWAISHNAVKSMNEKQSPSQGAKWGSHIERTGEKLGETAEQCVFGFLGKAHRYMFIDVNIFQCTGLSLW